MIASYTPRRPHHHAKPTHRRTSRLAVAVVFAARVLLDVLVLASFPARSAHAL